LVSKAASGTKGAIKEDQLQTPRVRYDGRRAAPIAATKFVKFVDAVALLVFDESSAMLSPRFRARGVSA